MDNVTPTQTAKPKYINFSLDVLKRTPYAKEHPEVIEILIEQYATAPRYKHRAVQTFNRDHVSAADKWMREEISDEQFITFCGGKISKANKKNKEWNDHRSAKDIHYKIIKAKIKGKII